MRKLRMFITAVCVLVLIKLRWPKNKSDSLSGIQVQADMFIRRPRSSCRQGASLEKKCEILEFLPSHLFYYPAPGAPDVAFSHPTYVRIWQISANFRRPIG